MLQIKQVDGWTFCINLQSCVALCDSGTNVISLSIEVVMTVVTIPCNNRGNTMPLLRSFVQQVCTALP
jgi:hypothetical protein